VGDFFLGTKRGTMFLGQQKKKVFSLGVLKGSFLKKDKFSTPLTSGSILGGISH